MNPIHLFYEEPDPDRWFLFDRYPRQILRRLVRGKPRPGGQTRVFLNLCAGLDKLSISYRVNDYRYIQKHPEEVACIIGKPQVLDKIQWKNPILFGAAVFSHPDDDPNLFDRLPIRKILVPGEWMRQMCEPYYGDRVITWPVGIATDEWIPASSKDKDIDFLIYDKVRWDHEHYEQELINPIHSCLQSQGFTVATIRYGFYKEEEFRSLLDRCKAMIFLCEHETQGIAYQQALSCGVPILAWDRGGFWQDPAYFPHQVKFEPVSSVPYWGDRCGVKFKNMSEFPAKLAELEDKLNSEYFAARDYILENLTLEKCAQNYLDILFSQQ
ncbi:glycosyltransferase [Anabaena sp. FACHB-1250]|uniref:glycosyltransferase n=1 Tax=Anabaena sp. FACHB-1250 TaxID=2692770 RepID=UPI001680B0E2|nr:glycosyltransferase [Anabaena sp. FACHB-1250]MBD2140408.1 glycosyltransferase [Anabaena sp. FACHB-1250]